MKERSIIFRQSLEDFPCPVTLGRGTPSFGLHRFNKPLRFIPLDDEGYSLRGDKQLLLYKGQKRSHRFTILGDTSFEYDCILNKLPTTNVITLLIDGAENYDFFRQPDFVKNPLLKGSYAVYKKETLIGEGTGKLCHIHRPEIIDARGRRCWGKLAVVGNELRITIPEKWLGEATYPVVVDPVVGTSTIGANYGFYEYDYEEDYYDEDLEEWIEFENYFYELVCEESLATNRFLVPDDMYGKATAYVYLRGYYYQGYNTFYNDNNAICPCLYSDNNNKPSLRLSDNEVYFDHVVNTTNKPNGWRNTSFSTNQIINAGSYVWFGVLFGCFVPSFDYGAKCYISYLDDCDNAYNKLPPPDIYPVWNYWIEHWGCSIDIIISMYFNYTAMKHHVRTLTQGIKLNDKFSLNADYIKTLAQTVQANSVLKRLGTFFRKCIFTAHSSMEVSRFPSFFRTISDFIKATMALTENRSLSRKCTDDVQAHSASNRIHNALRKASDFFKTNDSLSFPVLFIRSLPDTATPSDRNRHKGSFIRNLLINATTIAETTRTANYYRFQNDTVHPKGSVFRSLLLFVHIITKVFVRDYLLNRFLIAREDLQLKSPICRELTLVSKLN